MRLIKWWYGWRVFGFAFYLRPERNPTIAFSKAGRDWGLAIGKRTIQNVR